MLGETVGNYRIERELGTGGMGAVYLARHALLDKCAAVKMLRACYSEEREAVDRFFTEARATTAVRHPGIVDVYDFGYHASGSAYLVMELLEGETFGQMIREGGRLAESLVLAVGWQVAGALAAAHREDIVHRDLKPDNVFVIDDATAAGGVRVKILDFGIAKLTRPGSVDHTNPGELIGTPLYMSPEQCRGKRELDGRSDVYQLGCVLYHGLAGHPPFISDDPIELLRSHALEPPLPLLAAAPDVSHPLAAVIERCLAKEPADRPGAAALAGELRKLVEGERPPARAASATPVPLESAAPATEPQPQPESDDALEPEPAAAAPRWRRPAIAGAVVVAVAAIAFLVLGRGGDDGARVSPPAPKPPAATRPAATATQPEPAHAPVAEPADEPPDSQPRTAAGHSEDSDDVDGAPAEPRRPRRPHPPHPSRGKGKKAKEWGALLD